MRTILKNGRCHTLNAQNDIAEAIFMENGRIKLDGPRDEVLRRLRGEAPGRAPAAAPPRPPHVATPSARGTGRPGGGAR